jgi:hypothetical protein
MTIPEKGDRIRLIDMPDDPSPIEPGAEGLVVGVVDMHPNYQIWVKWDSGRSLALVTPPDTFEIIGRTP